MKRQLLLAVAVLVPAFAVTQSACKKDESVAGSGSASASAAAASASGAASLTALGSAAATDTATAPTADPDKLPPPTAAATQAAQSVSTANYKTELDSIEKEINGIK